MSVILHAVSTTHPGLVRDKNEDAAYAGSRLVVLADGMGGPPAGEVASEIAVAVVSELADRPAFDDPVAGMAALDEAVAEANRRIQGTVDADSSVAGMGTTLTAALLCGDKLAMIHVGDSRAYLLRGGELTRLTRDDTYVQALVDRGALTPEEAWAHPHRALVTQALQGREVMPARAVLDPEPGDRLLLCSDGLSDLVDDATIGRALAEHAEAGVAAEELIALALTAGGTDNITTIVADVVKD